MLGEQCCGFPVVKEIKRITDVECDIVERVIQFVSNAGGELPDTRKLARLNQLLLFLPELLLPLLHFMQQAPDIVFTLYQCSSCLSLLGNGCPKGERRRGQDDNERLEQKHRFDR
jgi:hypothetical protein